MSSSCGFGIWCTNAYAQGAVQASIAGVVRDTSGAVLPGVTIEASSPVLIEKSRTAVSDDTGRYRIIALNPGSYTVTFTLAGFNTVRREGIELTGSLTATIDTEMRVGSLEETLTVTGESPIVDVQSIKQQRVIDDEAIHSIPGQRSYHNLVVLVPGLSVGNTQNVGGINGPAPLNVGGHGGANSEGRFNVDGLGVNGTSGGGTLYVTDTQNVSEVSIDITGGLGEAEAGGPVINVVPRTGGNTFSGSLFLDGANGSLQGGNFDDELVAAGLREPGKLKKLWDVNAALGGPIVKDRLWFYLTGRYQRTDRYVAGMYYNKNAGNPNSWVYDPDYSQQALSDGLWHGATLRTTWQISQRQKLNLFWDEQDMCRNCTGGGSATTSPEAQDGSQNINYIRAYQAAYTAPLSDRLLIEAGFGAVVPDYGNPREGFDRSMVRVVDQGGNFPNMIAPIPNIAYRSMFWDQVHSFAPRYRASLSYVTGAQNMKVGIETYNNISNAQLPARRLAAVPFQQRRAQPDHDAAERFHRRGPCAEHRHLRAGSLDPQAVHAAGRHPLRERVERLARTGDRAVAHGADADRLPGAGHREGIQRHHLPRWSGGRCVRHREDVAEDQRRHLHGSGAVGGHLHRAQSGAPAVRRWRAAADDPVLDRCESQLRSGLRSVEPGRRTGSAGRPPTRTSGGW